MALFTQIADVFVPGLAAKYIIERTAEKSALFSSGIIAPVAGVDIQEGARSVNLPFWKDIGGRSQVFTDSGTSVEEKITAGDDVAVVLTRKKMLGAHDLARLFSGDDPMGVIVERMGDFWVREYQKTMMAILKGVFASGSMSGNLLDASTTPISTDLLIDAITLMGDAGDRLTAIVAHSAVVNDLTKKNYARPSPVNGLLPEAEKRTECLGRTLIADDGCPKAGAVYTTYLFGTGAMGNVEGTVAYPMELARDAKSDKDELHSRRVFILHPHGVAWTGSCAEASPDDTQLSAGTNWTRVWENKNIPIVALKHKIGA